MNESCSQNMGEKPAAKTMEQEWLRITEGVPLETLLQNTRYRLKGCYPHSEHFFDDALQNAVLRILQRFGPDRFDEIRPDTFPMYFFNAARMALVDLVRAKRSRPAALESDMGINFEDSVADHSRPTDRQEVEADLYQECHNLFPLAVTSLSDHYRIALVTSLRRELTIEQYASCYGATSMAFTMRRHHAKGHVKEFTQEALEGEIGKIAPPQEEEWPRLHRERTVHHNHDRED